MVQFNSFDWRNAAVSALGAAALSAASVFAAAAPARAETLASLPAWQAAVERQIDGKTFDAPSQTAGGIRIATITAAFTPGGDFAGATLAHSSGDATTDANALRLARHLAYPRLPVSLQGTARAVTLRLRFEDRLELAPTTRGDVADGAVRGDRLAAR